MGRPLKSGGKFEYEKSYKSYAAFEKYLNKKQKTLFFLYSEKNPNCKVYKRAGYIRGRRSNSANFIKVERGLTKKAKSIIEDLIYSYDSRPKPMHVCLNRKKYKKQLTNLKVMIKVQRRRKVMFNV